MSEQLRKIVTFPYCECKSLINERTTYLSDIHGDGNLFFSHFSSPYKKKRKRILLLHFTQPSFLLVKTFNTSQENRKLHMTPFFSPSSALTQTIIFSFFFSDNHYLFSPEELHTCLSLYSSWLTFFLPSFLLSHTDIFLYFHLLIFFLSFLSL